MVSTCGEKMSNLTVKQVNLLAKGKPGKTSDGNGLSFRSAVNPIGQSGIPSMASAEKSL